MTTMKKLNILSAVACILGLMISHADAFAAGFNMTQPEALGFFCAREPRHRTPLHFTCGGPCPEQNRFNSPFVLEVNAEEYWDDVIPIIIRTRNNMMFPIRGFTVAAVSSEGVVGDFENSLDMSYRTSQCPREGFFAMHIGPPETRLPTPMNRDGSVMLAWNGGGRNHGDITFVVYAVANQSMYWMLESHTLWSRESAEETINIDELFMDIVEDTFGVRSVFSDSGSHVGFRRIENDATLNDTLTEDGNETLSDGGNSTMKELPLNGAENGTFLTENGEIIPTLEEFEKGFMKRLQGGFNLDRPFNTFDRDEFTMEDFEVHDLDEEHFDPFDGVETPQFNPNTNNGFNPANPFGPNGPMGPFGPFGQNGQNPFGQNPFGPGQSPFGQNGQNPFGPGQNQFGPGQNQFGPGQNQFGPGQNQFGPGQNQFGQNGQNPFGQGPGQNQFGQGGQFGGPGQNPFGGQQGGQNPFGGPQGGQNPFGGPQGGQNQFGGPQGGQNPFGGPQGGQNPFGGPQGGQNPFGGQPGGQSPFGGQPGGQSPFGGPQGGQNPFGGPQGRQNPFGGPQGGQNPFGGPQGGQNPFGGPQGGQNPFGGPQGGQNPFGGPQGGQNPFGGPQGGQNPFGGPQGGPNPFGGPQGGQSPFGGPQGGQSPFGGPQGGPFGGGGGPFGGGGGGGGMPMGPGMFGGGGGRMQQQARSMVQQNPNSVFSLLTG